MSEAPFYLDALNEAQREAVLFLDGPELVIAGAGSGKTRVLTYKIVHLLARGYEPFRIMALTFTNKAAREMRERVTALSGPRVAQRLWMGTFHSIFARILRLNADRIGYRPNFTIYDSADSRSLIKSIIRDMDLDEKVYKPATVAAAISRLKNALISPQQYVADNDSAHRDSTAGRPRFGQIYAAYVSRCRVAQAMDFDDLLFNTNVLLRDNPDVLRHYRELFRYILVDEYQDTNFAQHNIVALLAGEEQRVCVVGDDAQSIYSFRGANISNILGLKRSFPGLRMFKLEQNYRSTENIINAAGTLIEKNRNQIPKQVFSRNGEGSRVEVVRSYSDYEESALVAAAITRRKRVTGDSYDEFAVLYRTNAQSRLLEESLRRRNIPYRIYGGLSFYARKEVKDMVAYFRLAINPEDDEAVRRVINVPARGIGETTLRKLTAAAMGRQVPLWTVISNPGLFDVNINRGTAAKLQRFADIVTALNSLSAKGVDADVLAREAIQRTGMLAVYASDRTPENIAKAENVNEVLAEAVAFVEERREQGMGEQATMTDFMAELSLKTDSEVPDADGSADKVTLMTIHAAKGLEFGNVYVVGVEDDLLPSLMSKDDAAAIEEERRLLYVAITRAKRYCMLSYAQQRFRNGMTVFSQPSPFLRDIDSRYLSFSDGSREDMPRESRPVRSSSPFAAIESGEPIRRRTASVAAKAASGAEGNFTTHTAAEVETGQKILHPKFGHGVIVEVDGDNPAGARIKVSFSEKDIKTLLLAFAKFQFV